MRPPKVSTAIIGRIMKRYKKKNTIRSLARVHWLLFELTPTFKGYYKLLYDYETHSYCFYHNYCNGRSNRLKEVFIVIRTSKRCYRMMYHNYDTRIFVYRSFSTAHDCASFMLDIGFPFWHIPKDNPKMI